MPINARVVTIFTILLFSAFSGMIALPEWHQEEGYRWAELTLPDQGNTGFALLPSEETGINFVNVLTDQETTTNRILMIGSGVAIGDYNNDGWPDLYFARLNGDNVLYKNLGDWKFEDVTVEAGVGSPGEYSRGATFSDIDGDSDVDLLVSANGNLRAFRNEGNGKFTDITKQAGLTSKYGSTTLALADVEGDGDLDLYVANYRTTTFRDGVKNLAMQMQGGKLIIPPELQDRLVVTPDGLREYGEPSFLYLNNGKGIFAPVSWTGGAFLDEDGKPLKRKPLDWSLTATFRDIDQDGDPDLYECNDFWTPERFWLNNGNGHFRAIDRLAVRKTAATSMGVDFADIDRDGDYDFYVLDMLSRSHQRRKMEMGTMKPTPLAIGEIDNRPQFMRNMLYLNRGDDTYAEIAYLSHVEGSEWSWQPVFIDVDLDGYEDIIITNGHARDVQDADTENRIKKMKTDDLAEMRKTLLLFPVLKVPKVAFHNQGNLHFEEVAHEWGIDQSEVAHGIALGDLDRDGDLDFVLNNLNAVAGVYRNNSVSPRVAVQLKGFPPNTQGVGARITLRGGTVSPQMQEIVAGGRYLSGSQALLVFAAGKAQDDLSLEVFWRSGKISRIGNVKPNRIYEIDEASSKVFEDRKREQPEPVFADVSTALNHVHHENPFDDFQRQILLPNRLSQLGPGVAWHDFNHDGYDDLVIASGAGGRPALYWNNSKDGFTAANDFALAQPTARDQISVVGWSENEGASSLLISQSNFEDGKKDGDSLLLFQSESASLNLAQRLSAHSSSLGPVAIADIDSDGDLDLFAAGRTIPGRYPEPATSRLYLNQGSVGFTPDSRNDDLLKSMGLVSSAVFSDLDQDGDPDLVLAVEWGPIRILINQQGTFTDATENLGLAKYLGWWNGVTTGDLNEDGKFDIVATNWGLNSKYHYSSKHPLHVYYDDFDRNGELDILETHYDEQMKTLVPERGLSCSSQAMPFIKTKLPTYEAYGGAGLRDIYGSTLDQAKMLTANDLEHKVFVNKGDHFEAIPLPLEAQFAPGFGVNVADYDGDGHEDVFITQNFFASQIETPPIDAGRGLWMKGDGKGGLVPVPGQVSGIKVYGDARGSAVSDYDADGRVDLIVTQNGAATKLYRNQGGNPGLRIRLVGPAGNFNAVGAAIQLAFGDRMGPAREIHGSSGYSSQDSFIQVLGIPEQPTKIVVRWPGGKKTITNVPIPTPREITIRVD